MNHDHCVVAHTLYLLRYQTYLTYYYIRMEFKAIAPMLGRNFYITLSLPLSLSLYIYIYIHIHIRDFSYLWFTAPPPKKKFGKLKK